MRTRTVLCAAILGAALVTLGLPRQASAAPVLGGQLFYTGGEITITTLPVTSGFVSELGLYDATLTRLRFLTFDEPPGVSVTFDPGIEFGFTAGQELIFGIRVLNTGFDYFMGPASRNPDNVLHAQLDGPLVDLALGLGFEVGFEDLHGGGDLDYDDNRFFFRGGVRRVPEPMTALLIGTGLAGLVLGRRRR